MQTASEAAQTYQEISFLEEDLQVIHSLCERLSNDNYEMVVGMAFIKDEPPAEQQTALVQSTLGMLAVQIAKPSDQPTEDYTWVVNEVTAIRLLGVMHDSLTIELNKLKHETER